MDADFRYTGLHESNPFSTQENAMQIFFRDKCASIMVAQIPPGSLSPVLRIQKRKSDKSDRSEI